MKMIVGRGAVCAAVLTCGALVAGSAYGDPIADFYKGRTVTMIAAASAGGGYDAYGRVVAKYLSKYLPGQPNILMQFMPGAGGTKAANYLYNVSARDGSILGLPSNAAPVFQALGGTGVKYDASKFNYIGRAASMQYVIMVWHTAGVKSLDDMKTKQVIFGATGKSQSNYMVPIVLKNLFHLKAKVITGYPGTNETTLALEKGELTGRAGAWSSWLAERPEWIKNHTVIPVAQSGLERARDLPNAPLLLDLARSDEEHRVLTLLASDAAVGRGFMTTPSVPQERVQALRRAFDKAMADPAFREEAKKRNLVVEPWTGEKLQQVVDETVSAPPKIIARAKQVLDWK
jgi:tripartite-type tricarboxylate transporter receptor subunit TctC